MSARRALAWLALGVGAALPVIAFQHAGYDFLFYTDRARMLRLAWLGAAVPLLAVGLAAVLGAGGDAASLAERAARAVLPLGPRARFLALAAVFAAGVAVALGVLLRFPNSGDEYAYLFQAETYARGRLWIDVHPLNDFVRFTHGKVIDGKWVSRFPPGWPLFLAPFRAVGIPAWLVNPAVAAGCVAGVWLLGRRAFGERAALLGAALFALSPFLLLNAGAYYSHPFAALLSLVFAVAASRYLEQPTLGLALVAGVALGWLGLARHMNAPLLFLPFLGALLWRRSAPALLRLWPLLLAAGAFLALLLAYDAAITGDPFVLPTSVNDPKQVLGFVGKHTPARALKFIQHRLLLLSPYTSGGFLTLYVLALGRGAWQRDLRWWDAYFLLEVLGYSLYHNASHDTYGPRYLFEAFPFAALRIAAACAPRRADGAWQPTFTALAGVHLASAVLGVAATCVLQGGIVRERRDPLRAVEEARLRDAVVFVVSDTSPTRRMPRFDLVRNGPDPDHQPVIWAHLVERRLDALRARWPERSLWVYVREPDAVRGRLVPLDAYLRERREAPPGV